VATTIAASTSQRAGRSPRSQTSARASVAKEKISERARALAAGSGEARIDATSATR